MKRAIYTAIAVLLIACLDATANAQNTQEASSDPCEVRKEGCVKVDYDRFKDRTTVLMSPVFLVPEYGYGSVLAGIQLAVSYSSPGKTVQRPDQTSFFFMATDRLRTQNEPEAFNTSRGVYLLIDGSSHPLGEVESLGRKGDTFFPTWVYSLTVPFEVIEKMAAAKSIEIRAGSVETDFDEDTQAAFRRLVELVPKEERPIPQTKEKIGARKVKHPKRTHIFRQRGKP